MARLGLVPLALRDEGEWDPEHEYWGEEDEPIEDWAKPIIARGKRPMFEMEQVIPGADPDDFDSDPIIEAVEFNHAGDRAGEPAASLVNARIIDDDLGLDPWLGHSRDRCTRSLSIGAGAK